MQTCEVEIKSLLGNKEDADALIQKMRGSDPQFQEQGRHRQLNHYFVRGDLRTLFEDLKSHMKSEKVPKFKDVAARARDYSVRTRLADKDVILVVKATVDDASSSNGTARMEFETKTPNLTLEQLDELVIKAGFEYQAKWSRERIEFKYRGLNVSIDKNAGYGFLAEFESQVDDLAAVSSAKETVRSVMNELGVEELPQDRLERMFAHYNENWRDYYGTERTFVIE
jgi:predicted adenylyl cyclase CyaB